MTEIEEIYKKAYSRYISPSMYEKMFNNGWRFEYFPFGGGNKDIILTRIEELLIDKHVKCGYMATAIRGYHTYYFIYKKK